jgi:hypothetical protein
MVRLTLFYRKQLFLPIDRPLTFNSLILNRLRFVLATVFTVAGMFLVFIVAAICESDIHTVTSRRCNVMMALLLANSRLEG